MKALEEILSEIPKYYHNSKVVFRGAKMTLSEYIEHALIPMNPNASSKDIVSLIKNKYLPVLKPDEKMSYIENFIQNKKNDNTFISQTTNGMNTEEYLLSTAYEHMDDEFNVTLGGVKRTLQSWYESFTKKNVDEEIKNIIECGTELGELDDDILKSLVSSKYNFACTMLSKCRECAISSSDLMIDGEVISIYDYFHQQYELQIAILDQKIQECQSFLSGLSNDLLDSKMNGVDMSLREYVISIIPTVMTNDRKVVFNSIEYNAKDYVRKIIEDQKKYLSEIEIEVNRGYEQPSLIDVIKVDKDNQATSEFTIPATDEEVEAMVGTSEKLDKPAEIEFRTNISLIGESIYNCSTEIDLEAKINQLRDIESRATMMGLSNIVIEMIRYCWELSNYKKQELVKVSANKDDLVECMEDGLIAINDVIKHTENQSDLDRCYYELNRYFEQIEKGRVADFTIKDKINATNSRLTQKSLVVSLEQDNNLSNNRMVSSEIEYDLMIIKNHIKSMEYESDIKYQTAYQISLQNEIETLENKLKEYSQANVIDLNTYKKFSDELAKLTEQSNRKGKVV